MQKFFRLQRAFAVLVIASLVALVAACGGDTDSAGEAGVNLVSPTEAASIIDAPPEDLVILDVRTPEEFQDVRIADSIMIDFYTDSFEQQIAELDRDTPYVLYCRSGNRSGATRALMESLGFTNVSDVDGGINAWTGDGLPTVSG